MIKYSLSRLLESLVTVFLIVTLVFLLMRLMPAEYFFTEDEFDKLTDEQIEERIVRAGLRDPIPRSCSVSTDSCSRGTWGNPAGSRTASP